MTSGMPRAALGCLLGAATVAVAPSVKGQANQVPNQSTNGGPVCPLSDSQTQKSIEAFAKVAAAFTQEDRCANCHGGVNPYAENGHHAGGPQENPNGSRQDCQGCHSGLPGWDTPPPEMNFMDGYHQPRPAAKICKQIKRFMVRGAAFVKHIQTNTDIADFNRIAFEGTRGLNERGQTLAFLDPYRPEPPSISRAEMVRRAQDWVDAMGGEFKGDEGCGCEPEHFAVRVWYEQQINVSIVNATKNMGPVDIPITFHDDGSYEGEQTVYFNGNAIVYVCSGESKSAMTLRVSGQAIEEPKNNHMRVQLENGSPMRGVSQAECPVVGTVNKTFAGGSQGVLERDLSGWVGEATVFKPSVGQPGINTEIWVQIVKVGAQ